MLETILGALVPLIVTFLLGFVAAWRGDFGPKDAAILNRMVLRYAVPLMLFAGMVGTPGAELSQDVPLLIALCLAVIGLYGAVLLLSRFAFRRRLNASALAAVTASAPAVPFSAVLGYLFGGPSAIPIAMASLVVNLTVVPVRIRVDACTSDPDPKCSKNAVCRVMESTIFASSMGLNASSAARFTSARMTVSRSERFGNSPGLPS